MRKSFFFILILLTALSCFATDTPPTLKTAQNLIVFQSKTAARSAWMWKDNGNGKVRNFTVSAKVGDYYVSTYDNSTNKYNKLIAFTAAGTDGSSTWPNLSRISGNNDVTAPSITSGENWFLKNANTSSATPNPNKQFVHLSVTTTLSSNSVETGTAVSVNYSSLAGDLSHATNNKWNFFYSTDGGTTKTRFSTENMSYPTSGSSAPSFTPSVAGDYTVYAYLTDPWGVETIVREMELTVYDPEPSYAVTLTNATVASVNASEHSGASITAAAAPAGKKFKEWTTSDPSHITFTDATASTTDVFATADGEATATYEDKTTVRLYYSNPNNWNKVYAYMWKNGSNPVQQNNGWHGVEVTNYITRNCVKYYYVEFYEEDNIYDRIIFNDGVSGCTGTCTSQTANLTISSSCYNKFNNAANSGSVGSWSVLPEDVNHTVNYSGEGVTFDGATSALCGETVSFTATADEHYTLLNVKLNGNIITPTAGTYSYTVQSSDDAINVVGTAIHENAPRTTIQALVKSEYNGGDNTVRVYFMNRSADFLVLDSPSPDVANSEYAMNNLGEQTIDGHSGILYELSYVGTCKLAIFVSKDGYHIGSGNKLTLNDVDMLTSAPATYYFDLSDVTAGSPSQETFNDFHVALHDGYATFCYPSDVTVSDAVPYRAELTANSSETSGYQIDLYPLDGNNVPANTGVLLYSDAGNSQATINIAASDVPALSETNDFIGTIARVLRPVLASGEKIFVLSDISGIAFYEYTPEYIPAYRAYFRLTPTGGPASAPKRAKIVMHHNTATDVENVQSNNVQCTKMLRDGNLIILRDGIEYNVQGQRIQ